MSFQEIKDREATYVMQTYGRFPVCFDHGDGAVLVDVDGKEYVDLTSGIGVNCLGYHNPKVTAAVTEQANKLMHVSNLYYTEPMINAAEKLVKATGMSRVFFGNSGAEANEGMIKIARKYSHDKYGDGRSKIVTLVNSFHGRTITTLKATGQDHFHQNFFPFTEGFDYAEANDLEDLKKKAGKDTCGVMMELIQGESGVRPLNADYVKAACEFCRENDILFMVDEVQTGIGRSGALFSFQKFGVTPDVVSMAKGLGGGLPIGAVMVGEKCADVLGKGDHGSTFGGSPMSCAAASAVLDVVTQPEFLAEVEKKGEYLKDSILSIGSPEITDVRGMGLMLGIVLKNPENRLKIVEELLNQGVMVLTAGTDVIRLLPPLVITREEIDRAVAVMKKVFGS
ncbi:MAG: aspartate aminotransferase family protein [Bacillota bacterium]|uniref:Acetylornithine aminotransferase n=1 Tax=[Clostridium] aminophilum TaxID=1526 RepID=A0A1I6K3I8_9FIRM|nr:aspartate aminotransferase family protein [[Clostridium] aminophilum]MCR4628219.1 aspartate aminotransferase family protein [Clostridium sp.]MDT3843600.1 aspartate aminotransferase family protein [Bacillota bacterium]SFR85757.1 acetylornithine/N-succinyldiaminopimelate aminotransferase [[Clostridium] aminophilum]